MTEVDLPERRVIALEQEVDGEKVVTRYILEQVRRNGDGLAALRSRGDRLDDRLNRLERRLGCLETGLRSLRSDLPAMIAGTMREVLAERDARA